MASTLFSPIDIRGLTVPNRITVAPMCQYQAHDGVPSDWHMVHLGQFALGGVGLIIAEATGVVPEGRITPGCPGLWNDAQEAAFAGVVDFVRRYSPAKIGIQLAHAGRKASTLPPWEGSGPAQGDAAWETVGPSALPYLDTWPTPRAMDETAISDVITAFADSAKRAVRAGFDLIQIHAAHGYLLHQFLSPLSNQRTDRYGGSLENRLRLTLEVFRAVRAVVPDDVPVILRLSATDWVEGGWNPDEAVALSIALRDAGCDMIDVSSGGLDNRQKIVTGPGYQVAFSGKIRAESGIPTMAVGQITEAVQAETILMAGQADMISIARGMLWDPHWAWRAALALGEQIVLPASYARSNPALRNTPFITRK
ncbi:MAG: NADH:flavin oxidoreductase/NADH oxidase [Pseudotabrizicola sp.]|uniref:NADH:flavin oxidoreductase/NADH oxidase n=1 Tax=Pseudotabrizicola sp. TaxID=2939647 RepID=UPI0027242495|nr:NADH:flavin oxidoreductase/NADH oxidase [Pseudotabrizicola sp.]MDO9636936.1 NADH:flavin oxidoreductase/NADH oxidase [Pseudotabrizicola sp.]